MEVGVAHGGVNDLKNHVETKKHQEAKRARDQSNMMESYVMQDQNSVIKAEVKFTEFIIEHNLPFVVAGHAGHLFKQMFPDSKISKQFACGRTKTAAIINTLGEETSKAVEQHLRTSPFSLAADGSNDTSGCPSKLYPVLVRVFSEEVGMVTPALLSLPAGTDSTGKGIFDLDRELKKHLIPWQNCLSLGMDNAAVMMGIHKGVGAFAKKEHSMMWLAGSPCHLIHLAAEKAAHCLPVAIEELLVDICYYMEKNSKRNKNLRQV